MSQHTTFSVVKTEKKKHEESIKILLRIRGGQLKRSGGPKILKKCEPVSIF